MKKRIGVGRKPEGFWDEFTTEIIRREGKLPNPSELIRMWENTGDAHYRSLSKRVKENRPHYLRLEADVLQKAAPVSKRRLTEAKSVAIASNANREAKTGECGISDILDVVSTLFDACASLGVTPSESIFHDSLKSYALKSTESDETNSVEWKVATFRRIAQEVVN